METQTIEYETRVIGAGQLIKAVMDQLQVTEQIDKMLPYQPEIGVSYGTLAQIIILNRMTFQPKPLYQLADWVKESGVDHLLGIEAQWVDDDRMGKLLEHVADHAVEIWTAITQVGLSQFKLDLSYLHMDTTTVYFEGTYQDSLGQPKQEEDSPLLVKGYNKDGQPNKVQYVLSLTTAGRVPLWYSIWNGNQSDDGVYLADMNKLRQAGWAQENMVLVGDRKLCNRETMLAFSRQEQQFLAPHPWTETAKRAWRQTVPQLESRQIEWEPVSYTTKKEARWPAEKRTTYRVCEIPFFLQDTQQETTYTLRWVFSSSSSKAKLDQQQREKALAKGQDVFVQINKVLGKYDYRTRAKIETRLQKKLGQAKKYFTYQLEGLEDSREWTLTWQRCEKVIEDEKSFDGIALFCTNVPHEKLSAPEVMIKYKSQMNVEQTIDFIKSPIHLRPMWLHSPKRLVGLTLLIMLAVFIAGLIEQVVRNYVSETGEPIKGLMPEKRDNLSPTARKILAAFQNYAIVIAKHPDGRQEICWPRPNPVQAQIFTILGLPLSPLITNPFVEGGGK